jgi:hypothetical protein
MHYCIIALSFINALLLASGAPIDSSSNGSAPANANSDPYANIETPPPVPKLPKDPRRKRFPYKIEEYVPKPPNGPLNGKRVPYDDVASPCEDCDLNRDVINIPNKKADSML